MGCARGHIGAQGWSKGLISIGVNESRTRKGNNKLVVSPEQLSFLGKALWKVGASHLKNVVQEVSILLRISFRERSQQ